MESKYSNKNCFVHFLAISSVFKFKGFVAKPRLLLEKYMVFVIRYINKWHMKNTNFKFPVKTKMGVFFH